MAQEKLGEQLANSGWYEKVAVKTMFVCSVSWAQMFTMMPPVKKMQIDGSNVDFNTVLEIDFTALLANIIALATVLSVTHAYNIIVRFAYIIICCRDCCNFLNFIFHTNQHFEDKIDYKLTCMCFPYVVFQKCMHVTECLMRVWHLSVAYIGLK